MQRRLQRMGQRLRWLVVVAICVDLPLEPVATECNQADFGYLFLFIVLSLVYGMQVVWSCANVYWRACLVIVTHKLSENATAPTKSEHIRLFDACCVSYICCACARSS